MAYLNRLSKLTEEELPAFIADKKVRSSSHNSFVLHWTPSTLLVGSLWSCRLQCRWPNSGENQIASRRRYA